MPEQYLPRVCESSHDLERVAAVPSEPEFNDGRTFVCGKFVCRHCGSLSWIIANSDAPLCKTCGLPSNLHDSSGELVVVEGFGSVACKPLGEVP